MALKHPFDDNINEFSGINPKAAPLSVLKALLIYCIFLAVVFGIAKKIWPEKFDGLPRESCHISCGCPAVVQPTAGQED